MRAGAAACLLAWLFAASTQAGSTRLEVESAFGVWRWGDVAPLRVRVENDGPAGLFTVSARTVDAPERPRVEQSLELSSGARKAIWIALQPSGSQIEVLLSLDGRELDKRSLQLKEQPWSLPLIATLGPAPSGLAKRLQGGRGRREQARLSETSVEILPDDALLWSSLDQLLWPAPLAHELSPRQAEALRTWVLEGGRLIAGTNPEDPTALAKLGLVTETATPGENALGWGRVEWTAVSLRGAGASAWLAALELNDEPPAARTHGPDLLVRRAESQVEGAIEPPLAAGALVLSGSLLALAFLPWVRSRKAARGEALGRRGLTLNLSIFGIATLLSLAVAHFGAGPALVVDRLDLIDVDAATGWTRARSVIALRRAHAGHLEVDTKGAGRLRVIDGWHPSGSDPPRFDHALAGNATSSTSEVLSWQTVRLDARWRAGSVALPDLRQTAEQLHRSLGAERAAVASRGRTEWLRQGERVGEDALGWGARVLSNQAWGPWATETGSVKALMETALATTEAGSQWRWPTNERWPARDGERVLVAIAPGSSAPPFSVDGRETSGEAWTIWRVRLAERDGGGS